MKKGSSLDAVGDDVSRDTIRSASLILDSEEGKATLSVDHYLQIMQ